MEENNSIKLHGKLFLEGDIETKTGLHIGGATTGLQIGGVDSVVIRNPITKVPYIPGSSLKGKMRSLLEKFHNKIQNKEMQDISIHECKIKKDYEKCDVCKIFGIAPVKEKETSEEETSKEEIAEKRFWKPTRIIVRDAMLTKESLEKLEEADTDLPFTEVKWEAVIDRVTSKAMPRQIERVPAGVKFEFSIGYNVFEEEDKSVFESVLLALELLEQDYLGGQGTRGYGQVKFTNLKLFWNSADDYKSGNVDLEDKKPIYEAENIKKAKQEFESIKEKIIE